MSARLKVIGNYVSPYVRKLLVCLELKGLDYEIDPLTPFLGNDEFSRLSPLRCVPVLIDGDAILNDSSVICQYLEDKHPAPSLYPADIVQRAKARWLEEYADTRLGDVLVWQLFYQRGPRRILFGEAPDEALIQDALREQIPQAQDYLESQLPSHGYVCGELSIADISIVSFFQTASYVRHRVDPICWPRLAALVERVKALPAFAKLARLEDRMLRLPFDQQRDALAAAGAPLSAQSLASDTPRKSLRRE